jgi:heat shock protein HslJ
MRYQLLLILFMLSGCSLFKSKTSNPDIPLTTTHWTLYTLNGNSVPNLPNSIYLEFTGEKRRRFIGFAGCNNIFGEFNLNPNTVRFDEIRSTRMICTYADLEQEYLKMLKKSTHFKIRGHQLSFYESHTIIATFKAI